MTFHPDGTCTDDNAVMVASFTNTVSTGRDYSSMIEDHHREVTIGSLMRERSSVCG